MNKLQEIAQQLRAVGASLPAPENKGTPESALVNGLSIALLLVENAIKDELENPDNDSIAEIIYSDIFKSSLLVANDGIRFEDFPVGTKFYAELPTV